MNEDFSSAFTMSEYAELDKVFVRLEPASILLTPNRRLSRHLKRSFAQYQHDRGFSAWETLACYALEDWLQLLWQGVADQSETQRILLSGLQEKIIWQQAIELSANDNSLVDVPAMAELAQQTWHLLNAWRLPIHKLYDDANTQLFKQWLRKYQNLCDEGAWIDQSQLPAELIRATDSAVLPAPSQLALFDFDQLSPSVLALLDHWKHRGTQIVRYSLRRTSVVRRLSYPDEDAELLAAARWASAELERQPLQRIGIVIPQLQHKRPKVERIFTKVFSPQSIFSNRTRRAPGFNLSAAQSLSQIPLVITALAALKLNLYQIRVTTVTHLLGSPFWGALDELDTRGLLAARLRRDYRNLSFRSLRAAVAAEAEACPVLYRALVDFSAGASSTQARQLPSAWGQQFTHQLQTLGWPGERLLDDLEHQQVQRFLGLLPELANFDALLGLISIQHALQLFTQLVRETLFQASSGDSPLQILGLLEAGGIQFDALWVTGLDGNNWPQPPHPNSIIPLNLQRKLNMPRCSAQHEYTYAHRLTQRLVHAADQVLLSHAQFEGEQSRSSSRLIAAFPSMDASNLPRAGDIDYWSQEDSAYCEHIVDTHGTAIAAGESLTGGAQVFKDQSNCPFKAFAKHRLLAHAVPEHSPGVSAVVHGQLMHKALELVWRALKSHHQLMRLESPELDALINSAVRKSFIQLKQRGELPASIEQVQQRRMCNLVHAWLQLEKQRKPFSVLSNEQAIHFSLGGAKWQLRCDRIDRLDDGSELLMDYKTGKVSLHDWAGPRPSDPQVPLYCIAKGGATVGVAFAQIRPGLKEMALKGIAIEQEIAPGMQSPDQLTNVELPKTWEEIKSFWRDTLSELAQQYITAYAVVDPDHATTCRYCDLHSLCRIREQGEPHD